MKTIFCLVVVFTLFTGCTVYTEKQSEVLSQSVYATKDSITEARIDLADKYINEAVRIVKPPKNKISISGIYTNQLNTTNSTSQAKNRVILMPEQYKGQEAIAINSEKYEKLLENKDIFGQLELDKKVFATHTQNVNKELSKQERYNNQMVLDLNRMQKQLVEKNLLILRLYIAIGLLSASLIGGIYLRMKGIL
jgi:hypothetical protein